jgi:ubiquinone/menaquinone biosynthesis C-methylase UbiE
MAGNIDKDDHDLWSDYWRTSQSNDCASDFPKTARQAIAANWRDAFAQLERGDSVLDVATGNGALVALLASTAGPELGLSVIGVDLAQIDPQANAGLAETEAAGIGELTFRGGIDAADLPFEDQSFTLVVSQFGLEYADFEKAIGEACRVARKRLKLLIHASDGSIVRQNGLIPGQVDWLRKELGLFDAAREQITAATEATRGRLTSISAAIRKKCAALENPDFLYSSSQYMGKLMAQSAAMGDQKILQYLDAMEAQIMGNAKRMQALTEAARSEEDVARAGDICTAQGYNPVSVTAECPGGTQLLAGYWLEAERPR